MICAGRTLGKGGTGGRMRSAAEGEHRTGERHGEAHPCLVAGLCYASKRGGPEGR